MEAICSSETSVDIQRTTRRYIPEVLFTDYPDLGLRILPKSLQAYTVMVLSSKALSLLSLTCIRHYPLRIPAKAPTMLTEVLAVVLEAVSSAEA
jgi:hypothetical protein